MLWSALPFGEAKVGIPYAILNDVNIYIAFFACLLANILVFPMMYFFLNFINSKLFKWRFYKKTSIYIARRARDNAKKGVEKYGFWGLMLFVMIPIPGTGVYAGTIASYLFRIEKKKAFWANVVGITLSSIIVWSVTIAACNI